MRILLNVFVMASTVLFALATQARDADSESSPVTGVSIESQYDSEDGEESGATSNAPEVPVTNDLQTLAIESIKREVPILLMFSAEDCEYCERLEAEVVRPMLLSGEFDQRVIFRKIMVDDTAQLRDFHGSNLDPEEYAFKHKIQVTPTLMFVDSKGIELVPKVIGYQVGGLFMAYLDQAIDTSQLSLKQSLQPTP